MHKRFRILLGAVILILSSLVALVPADTARAWDAYEWGGGKYKTTDGEHIKDISCTRWDISAPSGESSTNQRATITFTFADGFSGSLNLTAGTFLGIGWINCQDAVNDYINQLTTGNRTSFMRCTSPTGCFLGTNTDQQYSLTNADVRLFPDDQPPASASITATPNAVSLTCPPLNVNTVLGDDVGTSDTKTVTVSLSGTTAAWSHISSTSSSILATKNGNQLSIMMMGLGCAVGPEGISTRNDSITIGVPGTNVTTTIAVNTTLQLNDVQTPDNPLEPGGTTDPSDAQASECNAGKMGWALCPIMEGLDQALGNIYGFIEENFLQVRIEFYNINSDTYQFWQNFRNIANVVFVIIFLIVILSQVTNVGINNYGIKKMLPELIMAALLINLSYFICQAMVDLSNIVGVSIRGFLDSIVGGGVPAILQTREADSFLGVVGALAGISLGVFTVTTILSQGVFGLILAFLLVLLAAAIAILMMFVILVIRQIGIIILIVIAPLAFAARILPNTQSLFKKWWSSFVALLVVYPTCSLVIGLGAAAATIMGGVASVSDSDFTAMIGSIAAAAASGNFDQLAALNLTQGIWLAATVLAMIVPYFAVISLSKTALNGLGKLGGMITGRVTGAGAGLNKLGNTGLTAGAKKLDQATGLEAGRNARRNAKTAIAKAKADQIAAKKAASGKGIYGKMDRAEFEAGQNRDEMAKASVGEYNGTDARMQQLSRANAIRLGTYKAGGTAYDADIASGRGAKAKDTTRSAQNAARIAANPDKYGFEAEQQFMAQTAGAAAEAKDAKKYDDSFATMTANGDVIDSVYTAPPVGSPAGTLGAIKTVNGKVNTLQTERAIADLIRRGDVQKAADLTRAYTAHADYIGNTNAQKRLSNVLMGAKGKSNVLHAYGKATGKALQQGATTSFSLDQMSQGANYVDNTGTARTADLSTSLRDDYTAQDIAASDKDDFELIKNLSTASVAAGHGAVGYSAEQYANAITSGASAKKIGEISGAITANGLDSAVAGQFNSQQIGKLDNASISHYTPNFKSDQLASAMSSGSLSTDQITAIDTALSGTAPAIATKRQEVANQFTGQQITKLDETSFKRLASDFKSDQLASAITTEASADKVKMMNDAIADASMTQARNQAIAQQISAAQMNNMRETTFVEMANKQLGTTFGNMAGLQAHVGANAAAKTNLQTLFNKAYGAANAGGGGNPDVAKHWDPNIRKILGV
jgi:hypothetical protein